ncbi:MAG: lipocalin family protein [Pseudomonadota bacterium]
MPIPGPAKTRFAATLPLAFCLPWLLTSCLGIPQGVQPVSHFDLDQYLGEWYEIARLDHSFERGLTEVTARYSLRDDGGVKVVNRGFDASNEQWREAEGRAYFVNSSTEGYLKVSFFGPFYGSYIVFELDPDYRYAFVSGANTDYLWLLAREPTVDDALIARFKHSAQRLGFDTSDLIFPQQSR